MAAAQTLPVSDSVRRYFNRMRLSVRRTSSPTRNSRHNSQNSSTNVNTSGSSGHGTIETPNGETNVTDRQRTAELQEKLKKERIRLITFTNAWYTNCPGVPPGPLARAGFFYFGDSDKVQCVFCLGVIKGFRSGDDPVAIHKRVFNRCPFMLNESVGNVPLRSADNDRRTVPGMSGGDVDNRSENEFQELGIFRLSPIGRNDMHLFERRMRSFQVDGRSLWQTPLISVHSLATAGFHFVGPADTVACYHCGVEVANWSQGEDPWQAHARSRPSCAFVAFQKGLDYAERILRKYGSRSTPSADAGNLVAAADASNSSETLVWSTSGDAALDDNQAGAPLAVAAEEDSQVSHTDSGYSSLESTGSDDGISTATSVGSESSGKSHSSSSSSLGKMECSVCLEIGSQGVVLLPCSHLCSCKSCAPQLTKCPICRTEIKGMVSCFIP